MAPEETLKRIESMLVKQVLDKLIDTEGVTAKQEEAFLSTAIERIYGRVGSRLAKKLIKAGKIRSEGSRILIHGYLARVERELALDSLIDGDGSVSKPLTHNLLVRILTEAVAESQHATLHKVASEWIEAPKSKAKYTEKPARVTTTRSQSEIDEILDGSAWQGAILAADAEQVPRNFARLSTLTALGISQSNLSNPLRAIFLKAGLPSVFILKGYYREDLLKAAALKLREPARSQLKSAIERSCGEKLLQASFVAVEN